MNIKKAPESESRHQSEYFSPHILNLRMISHCAMCPCLHAFWFVLASALLPYIVSPEKIETPWGRDFIVVSHHCIPSINHLVMLNKYYGIKKAHSVNIVKNGSCYSLKMTARPSPVLHGWPTNQPRHSSGATILGSYQRLSKRRDAGQSWTGQGR